ncbi:MAG: hypothetical protein V4519_02895 [Patescibacteria group bacterium]
MQNKNFLIGALIAIVIIVTAGFFVLASKKNTAPVAINTATTSPSTNTQAATSTTPNTTATTTQQAPNDPYPGWKTYQSNHLGMTFRYPTEYLLKSEGYSSAGMYTALFNSSNGNIVLTVDKKLQDPSKERLQSKTVTIGGKDGTLFTSRRDVCDVAVARTTLDAEYGVQIAFESCGSSQKLFSDTKTIDSIVKSTFFQNKNTTIFVSTPNNIAFRYYAATGKPVQKNTSTSAQFTIGKNLTINTGAVYSTTLKKNLTLSEVVTEAAKAPNVTNVPVMIDGKQGQKLTHTPTTGAKQVAVYVEGKTATDIIMIRQTGVDTADLDLAVISFKFIK